MILKIVVLMILSQLMLGITDYTVRALRAGSVSGVVVYLMSYFSCVYMVMIIVAKILE